MRVILSACFLAALCVLPPAPACMAAEEETEPAGQASHALSDPAVGEEAPDEEALAESAEKTIVHPTHKQTQLVSINAENLPKAKLLSFCLSPSGEILAACQGESGEVRVFSATGEYQTRWELPVAPEAINVGSDGKVYVAGEGQLLRLTTDGEVIHQAGAPHVKIDEAAKEKLRDSIVQQRKASAERWEKSIETRKKMAERFEKRYQDLSAAAEVFKKARIKLTEEQQKRINLSKDLSERWTAMIDRGKPSELTEEQLEDLVDRTLQSRSEVASISESGGEVFLATRDAVGYGYSVWRVSADLSAGEVITEGLRGCCGQMDVQCCENGVYVAENSRHRVYHIGRDGEELGQWGQGAREGLEGFGSCCNPMNVAFGPGSSVYTAEATSGRIKRYSPEGELIELVGKVDVVPGCKKVSIAVDTSGDRVYMMDLTRDHIVLMERLAPGEQSEYTEVSASPAEQAEPADDGEEAEEPLAEVASRPTAG